MRYLYVVAEKFQLGDWCYSTNVDMKDAIDAEKSCTKFLPGGHLAWFTDDEEFNNVKTYTEKYRNIDYWYIGNYSSLPYKS